MTTANDGSTPPTGEVAAQVPTDAGSNAPPPAAAIPPAAPAATPPTPATPPPAPVGAPEAYTPFTVGDGLQLDQKAQDIALPIFKSLNLPQEHAQKIVDAYGQISTYLDQRTNEAHQTLISEWQKQGKADSEFGGAKYDQTLVEAQSLIGRYGDAELKEFLESTGVGNQPGLLRMFARIGKHFSEATIVPPAGDGGTGGRKPLADLLYGEKK